MPGHFHADPASRLRGAAWYWHFVDVVWLFLFICIYVWGVRYISTRGEAPPLGFIDVMLTGLARDGGLYVPETWPQLSPETIAGFFGRPYGKSRSR
jgi:hypothetical protein